MFGLGRLNNEALGLPISHPGWIDTQRGGERTGLFVCFNFWSFETEFYVAQASHEFNMYPELALNS